MQETPIEFCLQKQLRPNVIKISLYESNHRSKEKGSLQENSNLTKTSVNSNVANMINCCGSVKLSRQMFFERREKQELFQKMNFCSKLDSEGNTVAKIESELRVIEPYRNILKRMT